MPEVASIATGSAPILPTAALHEPPVDRTLLVPAVAFGPPKLPAELYRVTMPLAELRAGPSPFERSTARLVSGDRVVVLTRFAGRWFFVRLADGKTEGYLDATLLSPAD